MTCLLVFSRLSTRHGKSTFKRSSCWYFRLFKQQQQPRQLPGKTQQPVRSTGQGRQLQECSVSVEGSLQYLQHPSHRSGERPTRVEGATASPNPRPDLYPTGAQSICRTSVSKERQLCVHVSLGHGSPPLTREDCGLVLMRRQDPMYTV